MPEQVLQLVCILLEPWRAGKSIASLSSEMAPRAWAYRRLRVSLAFSRRQSVLSKIHSYSPKSRAFQSLTVQITEYYNC